MRIPHTALEPETLLRLIEEFVTREGTEYGHTDHALATKVAQVRGQLERGEASIVFDAASSSCHIVSSTTLAGRLEGEADE